MTVIVRAAVPADAPAMGAIHVAAWRAAYAGIMDPEFLAAMDPERGASWWHNVLDGRSSEPAAWAHLVAELDGRVVAMAAIGPARDHDSRAPRAQLWMLNAHPDAFGTGAATELHRAVVDVFEARGCASAYLWVARDNPRARRFYEREGWVADGAEQAEHLGGADVDEVRYRRAI